MSFKFFSVALGSAIILAACGSPYRYLGKTYPSTPSAELFFREADIPYAFEIMGKLDVEMPANRSTVKIQKKVMQIAADNGANVVLIDNFDLSTGGFTSAAVGGDGVGNNGGAAGASARKTRVNKNINVKATLVKYKVAQ